VQYVPTRSGCGGRQYVVQEYLNYASAMLKDGAAVGDWVCVNHRNEMRSCVKIARPTDDPEPVRRSRELLLLCLLNKITTCVFAFAIVFVFVADGLQQWRGRNRCSNSADTASAQRECTSLLVAASVLRASFYHRALTWFAPNSCVGPDTGGIKRINRSCRGSEWSCPPCRCSNARSSKCGHSHSCFAWNSRSTRPDSEQPTGTCGAGKQLMHSQVSLESHSGLIRVSFGSQ
jgi:hypothetical protein